MNWSATLDELERQHDRGAELPEIGRIDAQMILHEGEIELVDGVLDQWCHQPRLASAVFFSSSSVNAPCAASIGTPRPKNEASPFFTARRQAAGRVPRTRFSAAWWKRFSSTFEAALQRLVPAQAGWSICR